MKDWHTGCDEDPSRNRTDFKKKCLFFLFSSSILIIIAFCFILSSNMEAFCLKYSVRKGDTIWKIAKMYNIDQHALAQYNNLSKPYRIRENDTLTIPLNKGYLVRKSSSYFKKIWGQKTKKMRKWKYIVVHHSATSSGSAKAFDRYHKNVSRMRNGLAYHFVVNNGSGNPNGYVETGRRWKKQLHGGHTSSRAMNAKGIGICLVGNFEKSVPTSKQLDSLETLIEGLQNQQGIPDSRVIRHKDVKKAYTHCPGKRFPWKKLKKAIKS